MSGPMQQALANFAGAATAIAINSLWEGALLVVCIWLLLRAWPGINAATRYIVWSATLVATVVVPVATTLPFLTPSSPSRAVTATAVRVPIPMVTHALTAESNSAAPAKHAAAPVQHGGASAKHAAARARGSDEAAEPAESAAVTAPRMPERFRFTLPLPVVFAVLGIWAALALLALLRLAIGLYRLEQLKRDALPLPVEYRDAMARWLNASKGRRDVRLCVSDEIDVPVAVGLFDAMILIPRALLERLSESEVDQISLHELAHLRRADDWSNGMQRLAIALFGWNPAVLFVGQQLDLEREVACDDWVLASTGLVRPYAVCLAKMAETSSWPYRPMPAPGVFATRKHISLRIERLLGAGRNAATSLNFGPAAVTLGIVGGLAFVMQFVAPSVAASMTPVTTPSSTSAQVPPSTPKKLVILRNDTAREKTITTETKQKIVKFLRVVSLESPVPSTPTEPSPSVRATASATHVAVPAMHVALPATHMTVPATHVHVPETHVHVPATDVDVPAINVDVPAMNVKLPGKTVVAPTAPQSAWSMSKSMAATLSTNAKHLSEAAAAASVHAIRVADVSSVHTCNGCDMSGANLAGRDMSYANFTGTDLSHSNLVGTNFYHASLNGVDFTGAKLRGASFRSAHLTGCDFSNADLTSVDFTGATLTGCQFNNAVMPSASLRAILNSCTGCDFSHANLGGADMSHVRVNSADFSGANLAGANLSDSQFTGVDFGGARLAGANLTNTVFSGCDLGNADLLHVDLSKAKFIGTDFSMRGTPKP
jgi:uncharacterized protein YjbI with pentapeptide repeats/beta-lactamase regulating signal transducer with metallopeptidase domain